MGASDKSDRAFVPTGSSPQAVSPVPASISSAIRITGTQRCAECGRFIADRHLPFSRLRYVPLNEFGPEVIEWTCLRCAEAEA